MIDLVAFDLDGTVLDSEGRLAASAVEAIEELIARGIPTASISGRSIRRGQYPFMAYPALARALYIGGYNGSVVLGPGEGRSEKCCTRSVGRGVLCPDSRIRARRGTEPDLLSV